MASSRFGPTSFSFSDSDSVVVAKATAAVGGSGPDVGVNLLTFSGGVSLSERVRLKNVEDPVSIQDGATKGYVDSVAQGLQVKGSVRVATTAALGSAAFSASSTLLPGYVMDGIALVSGDRILVKDEEGGDATYNGIWVIQATTSPERSSDLPNGADAAGVFTFVEDGTLHDNNGFVCGSPAGTIVGTNAIEFVRFSGAGEITAGGGLTRAGNELSLHNEQTTITSISHAALAIGASSVTAATATLGITTTTGITTAANTAAATSASDGALVVAGGAGIGKNLHVGLTADIGGALSSSSASTSDDTTSSCAEPAFDGSAGSLRTAGGLAANNADIEASLTVRGTTLMAGGSTVNGIATAANVTAATSASDGALVVAGGAGIGKNLHVGLTADIGGALSSASASTTDATPSSYDAAAFDGSAGSLRTAGGLAANNADIEASLTVRGQARLSGVTTIENETTSDSATAGALIVSGGTGIGENLNVAGTTIIGGITTMSTHASVGGDLTVSGAGGVTAVAYVASSDRTLKQNISPISPSIAMTKVDKMASYMYQFKTRPEDQRCGVIAQELQQLCPELVKTTGAGTLAVDYNDLSAYLIGAIKWLKATTDSQLMELQEQRAASAEQAEEIKQLRSAIAPAV